MDNVFRNYELFFISLNLLSIVPILMPDTGIKTWFLILLARDWKIIVWSLIYNEILNFIVSLHANVHTSTKSTETFIKIIKYENIYTLNLKIRCFSCIDIGWLLLSWLPMLRYSFKPYRYIIEWKKLQSLACENHFHSCLSTMLILGTDIACTRHFCMCVTFVNLTLIA